MIGIFFATSYLDYIVHIKMTILKEEAKSSALKKIDPKGWCEDLL
jgi:hypothetical protein